MDKSIFMDIPKEFEELVIIFLEKRITVEQLEILELWLRKDVKNRQHFDKINRAFQLGITLSAREEKLNRGWKNVSGRMKDVKI